MFHKLLVKVKHGKGCGIAVPINQLIESVDPLVLEDAIRHNTKGKRSHEPRSAVDKGFDLSSIVPNLAFVWLTPSTAEVLARKLGDHNVHLVRIVESVGIVNSMLRVGGIGVESDHMDDATAARGTPS